MKTARLFVLAGLVLALTLAACTPAPTATEPPPPPQPTSEEGMPEPTAPPEEVILKIGFTASQTGSLNVE